MRKENKIPLKIPCEYKIEVNVMLCPIELQLATNSLKCEGQSSYVTDITLLRAAQECVNKVVIITITQILM